MENGIWYKVIYVTWDEHPGYSERGEIMVLLPMISEFKPTGKLNYLEGETVDKKMTAYLTTFVAGMCNTMNYKILKMEPLMS